MNNTQMAREKIYERKEVLRKLDLEERKRKFDKMPLKRRKVLESFGASPYQDGGIIRREFCINHK